MKLITLVLTAFMLSVFSFHTNANEGGGELTAPVEPLNGPDGLDASATSPGFDGEEGLPGKDGGELFGGNGPMWGGGYPWPLTPLFGPWHNSGGFGTSYPNKWPIPYEMPTSEIDEIRKAELLNSEELTLVQCASLILSSDDDGASLLQSQEFVDLCAYQKGLVEVVIEATDNFTEAGDTIYVDSRIESDPAQMAIQLVDLPEILGRVRATNMRMALFSNPFSSSIYMPYAGNLPTSIPNENFAGYTQSERVQLVARILAGTPDPATDEDAPDTEAERAE